MKPRALAVSLAATAYAILVACSAPEYRFASTTVVPEGGVPLPDGALDGSLDTSITDAISEPPPPAVPLEPIVVGGDGGTSFTADCNAVTASKVYSFAGTDDVGKRHCYLYFPNDPYRRTWPEAKVACGVITTPSPPRTAHLATFPGSIEANAVQAAFRSRQIPWIGLELTVPSAPTAKDSFHWVTGEPNGYDGWVAGAPSGSGLCVAWAESARWGDVPCTAEKGLLCELDE